MLKNIVENFDKDTESVASENCGEEITNHDIFIAISEQNHENFKNILQKGGNLNVKNAELRTPLDFAVNVGNLKAAEMLIQKHVNVNTVNKEGLTPLHTLIKRGDAYELDVADDHIVQIVKQLLANGAAPHAQDRRGNTAINCVAQKAKSNKKTTDLYTRIGKVILSHDTNVSQTVQTKNNMGKTPLDYLSRNGNITLRNTVYEALPQNRERIAKIMEEGNLAIERAIRMSKEEELA